MGDRSAHPGCLYWYHKILLEREAKLAFDSAYPVRIPLHEMLVAQRSKVSTARQKSDRMIRPVFRTAREVRPIRRDGELPVKGKDTDRIWITFLPEEHLHQRASRIIVKSG